MKRFATWCSMMAACGVASLAAAQHIAMPIDPPTPPPCAADGTCYPRSGDWGYYQGRWRTWPGVALEPTPSGIEPTPADGRVSPELGPAETPPPELEDAAAPPSSPKREAPPAAPAEPGMLPSDEPTSLEGVPLPDAENAPPPPPTTSGPTGDFDPPPKPPRSLTLQPPETRERQATAPANGRAGLPRVSSSDPPPTPPWVHSAAL